jgi:hypothetical protein
MIPRTHEHRRLRLEAIADPGAVALPASAWEQARAKVWFAADDLGEHAASMKH